MKLKNYFMLLYEKLIWNQLAVCWTYDEKLGYVIIISEKL